ARLADGSGDEPGRLQQPRRRAGGHLAGSAAGPLRLPSVGTSPITMGEETRVALAPPPLLRGRCHGGAKRSRDGGGLRRRVFLLPIPFDQPDEEDGDFVE